MVKVIKDSIVKEISENLLPDYERLGWRVYVKEEKKPIVSNLDK